LTDSGLDAWQNWRLRKRIIEDKKNEYDKLRKAEKALEKVCVFSVIKIHIKDLFLFYKSSKWTRKSARN
jgi:hypothetical protein